MSRHEYRFTAITILLGAITLVLFELFGIDSLDYLLVFLSKVKYLGVDVLIGPVFLIAVGLFLDIVIARRKLARQSEIQEIRLEEERRERALQVEIHEQTLQIEIREQRLRVMRATMRTVQHIVNNFLNNIQLFRMDAEEAVDGKSLEMFDDLILKVAAELTALGDLDETPERESCLGSMIDCESTRAVC